MEAKEKRPPGGTHTKAGFYNADTLKTQGKNTPVRELALPGQASGNAEPVLLPANAGDVPRFHFTIGAGGRQDEARRNFTNGDIFQEAKERVSVPEAARRLGLEPDRAGKIRCPFHAGDDTPSLQLYSDHWNCYGCGERGDAVDLAARYRNIGKREAAQWLLGESVPSSAAPKAPRDSGVFEREHIYPGGRVKKVFYRLNDGSKRAVWRHMDGGQWRMGKGDAPHILYERGRPTASVYIVEGEKDAESLSRLTGGYVVSGENGAGRGKWLSEYTQRLKAVGVKSAVIFSDNDEPGRAYAQETAAALSAVAERVKVPDLRRVWPDMPEKADVSDLIAAFGGEKAREVLDKLEADAPLWEPEKLPAPFPSAVVEGGERRGRGRPPKIPLSPDALRDELDRAGVKIRWNLITRRFDYEGIPESWNLNPETMREDFPVMLEYELKPYYSGTRDMRRLLSLIGRSNSNRYNPVLEYIDAEPWDGRDYLPDFCDLLRISGDALSCSLLGNWLWQGIALLSNDTTRNYSADGILTLAGEQGAGKTTIANLLGLKPEWTITGGRLDAGDKDTYIRMTSAFVAEFGEIDGTFKRTDAARLKAFITEQTDRFRRPYGACDEIQLRRTSYIATVNEPRFLIDRTGNRRYWTVPIETRIDCGELRRFNALGLWRQALAEWREQDASGHGGDCYRLSDWQREKLDKRNRAYLITTQAEDEIADIFAEAEAEPQNFEWRNATVSEFKLLNASLSRYSVTAISKALDALGHEMKRVKRNGKTDRTRYLPCRSYS